MKKNFPLYVSALLFLASCGTAKKLETATTEITKLNQKVTELNGLINERDKQIAELQKINEVNSIDAAEWRAVKALEKQKLDKVEAELAERGTSLKEIDTKMKQNVEKFKAVGCEVKYDQGKFFIRVPDDFTFESGSAGVGPQSRQALNVVAQVMWDDPGVVATIIGNTDTIPLKGDSDNWSLSTERANNVIRLLTDTYNINPNRLTAAGRGKYYPIANNDTPEGRKKNRRIEIIINPRLERLAELLDK